ncbi:MAG TPA: hypothetical protein PLG33_09165 [Prolixibacteraceae bacterium]|nr:hypothetical protein [Prolixibacteraceae bacterium]
MNRKILLSPELQRRLFRATAKGEIETGEFPEIFADDVSMVGMTKEEISAEIERIDKILKHDEPENNS